MKKDLILMLILKLASPFINYDTGWIYDFNPNIDASFIC